MELTDLSVLVLASVTTAALYLAVVVWTPRAKRWVWRVTGRAVTAAALVLSALITAGLYLNNANGWYSSWSDLFDEQAVGQVGQAGSAASVASKQRVAGPGLGVNGSSQQLPALPNPGTRLQQYTFRGARSGLTGLINVYLPASYTAPQSAMRQYPVIEALHGTPGSPTGWQTGLNLYGQVDAAVTAHRLAESIVVMPQVNIPRSHDGECVNGPAGSPQLETWLTTDVPSFVTTHLRARTDRSSWVVMGYSAGAWCAAMAGILHPDVFGGTVMFSGYFAPDFADAPPWPKGSPLAARYHLTARIKAAPVAEAMWIQSGRQSPYWPGTQKFLAASRPPLSVTTVTSTDTGHRWDVWKAAIPQSLNWIGGNVAGFSAT